MSRAAPALLLLAGCAIGAGEPYGQLEASLSAHYQPLDEREAGQDWQKLSSDFQVRLDQAVLVVDGIELLAAGADAETDFDPAHPPPGYSLCHNGHCHSDEGGLVSYEEIAASLGTGGQASIALRLEGAAVELTGAAPLVALGCGDCLLGEGRVTRVRLLPHSLSLSGAFRDGLPEPRLAGEHPFEALVDLDGGSLEASVDLVLDDDEPSRIRMTVDLAVTAALFDEIDFAALATDDGAFDLAADEAAAAALVTAFGELTLLAFIERHDP